MRRALVVALLLLAATLPTAVSASSSTIEIDRQGVAGDTVAVEIVPDGDDLTIQAGSTFTVTARYAQLREDSSVAWAVTDRSTVAFESLGYFTTQPGGDTHLELLTDHADLQVSFNETALRFQQITWIATVVESVHLSGRSPWTLAVSAPGAASVDVNATFELAEPADVTGEGTAGAGLTAAAEDFDGAAQVTGAWTVAADMEATATAPDGTMGFGVLFPWRSTGAGVYGVEAPGERDHTVVAVSDGDELPAARVLAGPSGTYHHWVDASAWHHEGRFEGRVAIFFAAPVL